MKKNIEKFLRPDLNEKTVHWIKNNLINHLNKNEENYNEIDHIVDFLSSEKCPNDIKRLSYEGARVLSDKWITFLTKQSEHFIELDNDIKTIIDFNNGFKIVQLLGKNAFSREGKLMSHCVGSYSDKKNSRVFSLRDANNKPHCTMEVTNKGENLNQIKGKGNGSIHPKYVKYILKFIEKFNQVNSNDMENLGYIDLNSVDDNMWQFIETNFTGIKFVTYKNIKYFYKYSKLIRKV